MMMEGQNLKMASSSHIFLVVASLVVGRNFVARQRTFSMVQVAMNFREEFESIPFILWHKEWIRMKIKRSVKLFNHTSNIILLCCNLLSITITITFLYTSNIISL